MENLKSMGLVDMTKNEMEEIEGGFIFALVLFIAAAIGGYWFAESVSS